MRNRRKTICYCLDSILCQAPTFPYEIIVVDDFSTDGCDSVVDEICGNRTRLSESAIAKGLPYSVDLFEKDGAISESIIRSRIRLYRHTCHKGAAAARNSGIEKASGKYLWFVDSDDFIAQGALASLLPIVSYRSYDIIQFSSNKYLDIPHAYMIPSKSYGIEEMNLQDSHDLLLMLSCGAVWCRLFRRDFVENDRFDLSYSYSEDSQFSWRMTLKAKSVAVLHNTLYGYMSNRDSLTSIKSYERFACYVRVVEDYISAINGAIIPKDHRQALLKECEKRLYFHAFYTFSYSEITREMWEKWYDSYNNIMVKNKARSLFKRIASGFIWTLHSKRLCFLIYKMLREGVPVIVK